MPQLSLYLDEATMGELKSGASSEGVSLSRYAARAIRDRLEGPVRIAGEGYWEKLYGCLADDDSFGRPAQMETRVIPPLNV